LEKLDENIETHIAYYYDYFDLFFDKIMGSTEHARVGWPQNNKLCIGIVGSAYNIIYIII